MHLLSCSRVLPRGVGRSLTSLLPDGEIRDTHVLSPTHENGPTSAGPLIILRFRVCRLSVTSCRGRARQALLRLNRSLTCTASLLDFTFVCQGLFQVLGDEGTRTPSLCLAKAPLSQLSYVPCSVGLSRLERLTFRLSGECSNQLSYRPVPTLVSLQVRFAVPRKPSAVNLRAP